MSLDPSRPLVPPARTHAEAAAELRRPFAPGAIGFRAMTKVPLGGNPYGGAQVAAYLNAQSVLQRLNAVVPGRWRQEFRPVECPAGSRLLYLACRLTITLPEVPDGPEVEAVYEDLGDLEPGSFAGLKALYSDARKRAGVAAGIGAYLYTALSPVILPIGEGPRQVRCVRRQNKADLLLIGAATEAWLRHGYATRMATPSVIRDLGEILAHGEPEHGTGQGEAAEHLVTRDGAAATVPIADAAPIPEPASPITTAEPDPVGPARNGHGGALPDGAIVVDFRGLGPAA